MDLIVGHGLHALAEDAFEVLTTDDRGAGSGIVQVGKGLEARVGEGLESLAVAARHHPGEDMLVDDHVSSDDGDGLFGWNQVEEVLGFGLVDRWEFILPFLGKGHGQLFWEPISQDSSFGVV